MALREACTAHPEVVTTHGPLSAPILRAMLGLDPYQTGDRDNQEAFAIAAQAMTIGIPGGSLGGGRDVDMVVAPPSPISSSSSSSEESSPESRRGRQRSGVRTGRLPSWLGGGRARDDVPPPGAFEEMMDEVRVMGRRETREEHDGGMVTVVSVHSVSCNESESKIRRV